VILHSTIEVVQVVQNIYISNAAVLLGVTHVPPYFFMKTLDFD
jgi:hypothetical protein